MGGNKSKRPTIAFQISTLTDTYCSALWPGVADVAREKDVNLIIFMGHPINYPNGYFYQKNIIYEFINRNNVDAFIMTSGILISYVKMDIFKEFYHKFLKLPLVSINVKLEGIPSILIENKKGMKGCVEHLIKVHGFTKIAFIKGPEINPESRLRFEAYTEALTENGIEIDEHLILPGNFLYPGGYEAVETLIDKRKCSFEAIVASNDQMALGVMEALARKGIRIPEDVAVAGFDDIEMARFNSPSLTTVRQPIYRQARIAAETVINMMEGKPVPEEVVLPAKPVIRSSCGCFSESISLVKDSGPKSESVSGFKSVKFRDRYKKEVYSEVAGIFDEYEIKDLKVLKIVNSFLEIYDGEAAVKENTEKFLRQLLHVLEEEIKAKGNIRIWQDIFTYFYDCAAAISPDPSVLSPLFHKARILIAEMMERQQAQQRLQIFLNNLQFRETQLILAASLNFDELTENLIKEVPRLGIKCFYLSVFDKEIKHLKEEPWSIPGTYKLIMAYDESGGVRITSRKCIKYPSAFLAPPDLLPKKERYTMVASSIYFRESLLGVMLYEIGSKDKSIYETLAVLLGTAIKTSLLFTERRKVQQKLELVLKELEESNEKLKTLSEKDELTGLYNRRGFLNIAEQNMNLAKRMKKKGIILYADLDGLKKINDYYGHKEGDNAIIQAGRLLRRTFRTVDIIGRIGGDEFVIFALEFSGGNLERIKKRLNKVTDKYNSGSGKPYEISITIGDASFTASGDLSVEELMIEADRKMYYNKRMKKEAASG